MTIETLAVIDAENHPKKFYGGIVLWDDKVVEAADCFRFMKKWDRNKVRIYCRTKGWKVSVVYEQKSAGG